MSIEFNCPHCGKLLTTSDDRAAARAKCPACDRMVVVPAPGRVPVATAPSGGDLAEAIPSAYQAGSSSDPAFSPAAQPPLIRPLADPPPLADLHSSAGAFPNRPAVQPAGPTVECPECGELMDPRAAYCGACGAPLYAIPRARLAAYWQRLAAFIIDGFIVIALDSLLVGIAFKGEWGDPLRIFVVWLLYCAVLESSPVQATLGKRAVGIFVCGSDGRRLSLPRAAIRTLAKILSLLICGVGFIMPLLTPRKQALHDILTDAVVLRK